MPKKYIEISKSFYIEPDFEQPFQKLGLSSIDAVFSFDAAKNLNKKNLASFRSRLEFEVTDGRVGLAPPSLNQWSKNNPSIVTLFLKRYDNPPIWVQLKNWLAAHGRKSCAMLEFEAAENLKAARINTPKAVAYGEQWGALFEKRSFFVTEKIPDAEAIERKLPDYFKGQDTAENLKRRRKFITQLAGFIRNFHETNYRHRDLYFSHIFYSDNGDFYLIDLARAFRPVLMARRYQIKDLAQIYYSAPGSHFSNTDRLRFYLNYTGRQKLTGTDKTFIRKILKKVKQIARHNRRKYDVRYK